MKGTQPSATLAFICMESFPLCSLNIRMSQQVLGASLLGALEGPQSLGSLRAPLGTRTAGQVGDLPAFWPLVALPGSPLEGAEGLQLPKPAWAWPKPPSKQRLQTILPWSLKPGQDPLCLCSLRAGHVCVCVESTRKPGIF